MKLNSYYPEPISAWAVINGNIPDVLTPVFSKINGAVVQVTKSTHLAENGMFVAFDGLTGTQAYLNGVWPVSSVVAGSSFQFTISGATVPSGTLTPTTVRLCKLLKSFNVSKVGKTLTDGYVLYFANAMDDVSYAVQANAMINGAPVAACSTVESTTSCTIATTDTVSKNQIDVSKLHVAVIGGIN